MSGNGYSLPSDGEREVLSDHLRRSAVRSLAQIRELFAVLGRLDEAGIAAVPYKGPALSLEAYGNLGLRECFDLDILVRRADVEPTRSILHDLGYRSDAAVEGAERAFFYRAGYHERFYRGRGEVIELHWAFTGGDNRLPFDLDSLEDHLVEVELAGRRVLGFDPETHFLILAVHGGKHRWSRLELIGGAAEVVRGAEDFDWDGLMERARMAGAERMLLLGARLCRDLSDVVLPRRVAERIARDPVIDRLVAETRELLATDVLLRESEQRLGSLPNDLYRFRLRERLTDRVRFIAHRLAHPSQPAEWKVIRFGTLLLPLHSILRPFRVSAKFVAESFRWCLERVGLARPPVAERTEAEGDLPIESGSGARGE